jgi:H+/Cl- antiporter ClcA
MNVMSYIFLSLFLLCHIGVGIGFATIFLKMTKDFYPKWNKKLVLSLAFLIILLGYLGFVVFLFSIMAGEFSDFKDEIETLMKG